MSTKSPYTLIFDTPNGGELETSPWLHKRKLHDNQVGLLLGNQPCL